MGQILILLVSTLVLSSTLFAQSKPALDDINPYSTPEFHRAMIRNLDAELFLGSLNPSILAGVWEGFADATVKIPRNVGDEEKWQDSSNAELTLSTSSGPTKLGLQGDANLDGILGDARFTLKAGFVEITNQENPVFKWQCRVFIEKKYDTSFMLCTLTSPAKAGEPLTRRGIFLKKDPKA